MTRAVLDRHGVAYTSGYLSEVVGVEEAHWFRSRDRAPRTSPYPYSHRPRDPRNQIGAIERVLAEFGVRLEMFTTSIRDVGADDAPFFFLLRGEEASDDPTLLLAETLDGDRLGTLSPDGRRERLERSALEGRWTGLIAVSSADSESGEEELDTHRAAQRMTGAGALLAAAVAVLVLGVALRQLFGLGLRVGALAAISLALKAVGFAASLQLKRIEATRWYGNALVERFCKVGEGFDCQRLLVLPGAKLLGLVSWSDVGLAYFLATGSWLILAGLWPGEAGGVLVVAAGMAVAALPYTAYSLYYQGVRARIWCMLCLSVQAILWGDAVLLALLHPADVFRAPSLSVLAAILAVATAAIGMVALHHRYLRSSVDTSVWRLRALAVRREPGAVLGMLSRGFRTEITPLPGDLYLGRDSEPLEITAVLEPECPHCAAAYRELRRLRGRTGDRFALRIRLMCESTPLETMRDLLAFTVESRDAEAFRFLDRWYDRVLELRSAGRTDDAGRIELESYLEWRGRASVPIPEPDDDLLARAVEAHREWQRSVFFEKWPVLFVNGHYWPAAVPFREYLDFYLDDLEEWALADGSDG